jgi:hypothetical protein
MKQTLLLALVLLLTSVSAGPVLADSQFSVAAAPQGAFSLVGKITSKADQSITVKVWWGNTLVQKYLGQELEIQVTETTLYFYKQGTLIEPISFSDLVIGQRVRVIGKTYNDVWTATKITVQGAKFSLVGRIKAIGADSITVKVWRGNIFARPFKGEEIVITVTDATLYYRKEGTIITEITFDDLEVSQKVTIKGYVKNNTWEAYKVTVVIPLRN